MGTIENRGLGSWRIGIKVKDEATNKWTWIRRTIHVPADISLAKQRKLAQVELAKLVTEYDAGTLKPRTKAITVREFAEMWMEKHVLPNCKPTTAKDYRTFLDTRILPMLGDHALRDLTPMLLTDWINEVRTSPKRTTRKDDSQLSRKRTPSDAAKLSRTAGKPISERTVRHYYDTLDNMLEYAVKWDFLPKNPLDKVDRPKVRKTKVNYLSEEEALRLLRLLSEEPNISYRAAVLLALLCGLRLGEVCELRISDVNFRDKTIDISRALNYTSATGSYVSTPKSEAGERLIALPEAMLDILKQVRSWQDEMRSLFYSEWVDSGCIVCGWNGAQLNHDTPSKWFRKFADSHGFYEVRFHDLRHTHATILLANGIDVQAVSTRMGHSDATTTLRTYAHALRRRDTDAANALDALMGNDDGE